LILNGILVCGDERSTKLPNLSRNPSPGSDPIVLLMVRSGAEDYIRRQVRRFGIRTYFPKYLESTKTRGMVARPLFPGYLFVWVCDVFWSVLKNLDGAFGCVRFGDSGPVLVPATVIKTLRTWEGPTGYIKVLPKVKIGSRVVLRNGVSGIYGGLTARHRIRILFSLLGQVVEREFYPKDLVTA